MGPARVTARGEEHPREVGLLFRDEIDLRELKAIVTAKPPFVGGSIDEKLERELLREGIITFTVLVNLDLLPRERSFTFIGLPLPIADGDGSPVRAVAILEVDDL
jgi:kynurenine formamidase